MVPFTLIADADPLILNVVPDPESQYTRVEFLNAVVTGIPERDGDAEDNRAMPAPALMFRDDRGREISIIVRRDEARAFKDVLERHPERTTVHELVLALMRKLEIQLIGTFVYDLEEYRYLAKLRLKMPRTGDVMEMACRSSDAILLSVMTERPIYIKSNLMDEFSISMSEIFGQR